MALEDLLSQKRTAILERWFHLILDTYPVGTSRFLERQDDRFVNPVGYTISQEIAALYDELLQAMNSDKLSTCLDSIIRIRSVQDFAPSQAVAFIFFLKRAIREELESEIHERQTFEELLKFESRMDELALLGFDIYMRCREKLYELRVNQLKAEREMAFRLLERANSVNEEPRGKQK